MEAGVAQRCKSGNTMTPFRIEARFGVDQRTFQCEFDRANLLVVKDRRRTANHEERRRLVCFAVRTRRASLTDSEHRLRRHNISVTMRNAQWPHYLKRTKNE